MLIKFRILLHLMHAKKEFYRWFRFDRFPIKQNKIVFSNYCGLGFGCNPKYICKELLKSNRKLEIIWLTKKKFIKTEFPKGVKCVRIKPFFALYHLFRAKIWVDNFHKISLIDRGLKKREGQYFIQTWHGSFGIKKIEADVNSLNNCKSWHQSAIKNAEMQDFLLSNSNFEDEVYRSAFWGKGTILKTGHPRNDIFFKDNAELKKKVHAYFGIDEDKKILIYVPTFRQGMAIDKFCIDYTALKTALENKFGSKWAILVRLHRNNKDNMNTDGFDFVYNATDYNDVQELLCACDAAITDYSSCIFDFMLTRRPAFIFAVDIEQYNTERGFYYSIYDTPFPVAQNNCELVQNIKNFNETSYVASVDKFLYDKGSVEDGNAAKRAAKLILDIIDNKIESEKYHAKCY